MPKHLKYVMLLLCILLWGHAQGQDKPLQVRVSIEARQLSLDSILSRISNQAGVRFSYNSSAIPSGQKIDLSIHDQPLRVVLDSLCLKIGAEYRLMKNVVILKPATQVHVVRKYTISGFVREAETGETLPGATVMVADTAIGTITNSYGFYSLTLPEGMYKTGFSFVGYIPHREQVQLNKDLKLDAELGFNAMQLSGVTIKNSENAELMNRSQMSRIRVNPQSLSAMPEFAGEVGLIKSLQSLPGIKLHSDGSAFFFVRGGNKDQNLILIDEAPVYNPAHLFGYYSVIIPEVAKEIEIYTGDLPLDNGDRLSSVIAVTTREGNLKRLSLEGVLNPFVYRLSAEGPLKKDKSSFFTSFRHSNFGWIIRREAPENDLYMLDVNAKFNVWLNQNNRLYFSFFYGKDNLTNNTNGGFGGIRWHNVAATLRWNHVFGPRLFSNATLYTGNYDYSLFTGDLEWNSSISNLSFKYDLSFYANPDFSLKTGLAQTFHRFNPGNLVLEEPNAFIPQVPEAYATKLALYLSWEHRISERFSYKGGFRIPVWANSGPTLIYQFDTAYQVTDTLVFQKNEQVKTYIGFDPRLSIKYAFTPTASLKWSFGVYHQYLNLISNSISPFTSFEIWLPAGINIKPQRAEMTSLGFYKIFGDGAAELKLESYYKWMHNQIDYEPHASLLLNPFVEGELRFGKARSYGLEFLLRKNSGRFTGWLSYTWSRVLKKTEGLNGGREFPAYYDRPHDLALFMAYRLSPRVTFSANWVYYTGSAITTPSGFYEYNGYQVPWYSGKNNDRLPDYHRLDLALAWMLNKPGNSYRHSLTFAIYNFYNRHNPVSVNFNKMETENENFVVPANLYGTEQIVTTQKFLLGVLPSITYKFSL